jgi:hypothetical protein
MKLNTLTLSVGFQGRAVKSGTSSKKELKEEKGERI